MAITNGSGNLVQVLSIPKEGDAFNANAFVASVLKASSSPVSLPTVSESMFKVRCPSRAGLSVSIGAAEVVLDRDGFGFVPEREREAFELLSRVKPGRIVEVVSEPLEAAQPEVVAEVSTPESGEATADSAKSKKKGDK